MGRKNIYVRDEDLEAINRIHQDLGDRGFSNFAVGTVLEAYDAKQTYEVLKDWFPESLENIEQREYNKNRRNLRVSKIAEEDDIPSLDDESDIPTL